MFNTKSISQYFFPLYDLFYHKLKNFYFKSNFYNRKISKNIPSKFIYKPSPHIINCLILYNKKKIKVDNFSLNSIWEVKSNNKIEFEKLHEFLWLNTLDIKTSKITTQNIIENWIENNNTYNQETWRTDILGKRIIAWISNTNLTLDTSNIIYRNKFILSIIKQTNHLLRNINNEKNYENKIIGCASLILIGLVFSEYKKFNQITLDILKKIIKINFDPNGFPRSRNSQELFECLKYFILIREWIKESQNSIPEFLDEIIYSSGTSFNFVNEYLTNSPLFNGSTEYNYENFKSYLSQAGYFFKYKSNLRSGYFILKNKKILLIMDVGNSTNFKFSKKYQCGCLSFEIFSGNNKLICNSGYYFKDKHRLNTLCKTTAAHSTLYIDNHSSCIMDKSYIKSGLKVIYKKINKEKDFDQIIASHNGYQKRYGYLHERDIKFFKKNKVFYGKDTLFKSGKEFNANFGIRFHIYPGIKMIKTQNSHTILLSMKNGDAWKFVCLDYELMIENGIFLGKKNKLIKNENIYISGNTEKKDLSINWSLEKIS